MKKEYLKKMIFSLIAILFIAFMLFVTINFINKNNINSESTSINTYESNNKYNSEFSIYDINSSETALYDKYITDIANEKIINQKINIEIKSIEKIDTVDKSTATTKEKEYVFFLQDYSDNCWITTSKYDIYDNSYNIQIKNDLICYGKYLGITEYNNKKYPQVDVSYIYKNIEKLDTKEYLDICASYLDELKLLYSKENFSFKEFKKETGYNTLIYINQTNDLEIHFIVDDMKIKMAELSILSLKTNLDTIDNEFLNAFVSVFDDSIYNSQTYLDGAKSKKKELEKNIYNKNYNYSNFELNGIISDYSVTNMTLTLYYK